LYPVKSLGWVKERERRKKKKAAIDITSLAHRIGLGLLAFQAFSQQKSYWLTPTNSSPQHHDTDLFNLL